MLKKKYIIFAFLFISLISFAQTIKGPVMGTVRTADGKPTDTSSHFSDITIIEKAETLNEVVVTGQFSPQSLRKSVFKVHVINSQKIEQKASTNLQNLLNTELGIRMSNDMALGETKFELMGMSGNNVKVLIDGVPVIDRGENKQSLSQIDVSTIERIEIVEGPMSVTYGSDALAGVINVITKRPEGTWDTSRFGIGAKLQEESAGKEYHFLKDDGIHYENISGSWSHKSGFNTSAVLTRNASGGWTGEKTGREKQWSPKDQYLTNATFGYKKKELNAWYRLDYLDETIYTPLNASLNSPNEVIDRDFGSNRISNQLQANWQQSDKLILNAAASYQNLERRTKTVVTDIATGGQWLSTDASAQDVATNNSAFFRTTASWMLSGKLSLQPGFEYQWEDAAGDRIQGSPDITDVSFFLSAEYNPFEWMSLRPGLRSVVNSVYDAPPVIPALNTKFSLSPDMDLRLSYAYGFRAPALRELYFSFHNASHNIDGNPDLKAENSNNFSGSYVWRILHDSNIRLTSTLSGFYNNFNDRITIVQDENDAAHNVYRNEDKYKTTGGTIENAVTWDNLQANLSGSYIGRYNSFAENDKYNDQDLPHFRFSPEITASVSYNWSKIGTNFNLFYKYTGARKEYQLAEENKLVLKGLDSYNWADLTASKKIGKYFLLEGGVKNLFNVTTITTSSEGGHGASDSATFVGCGRSYFLGFNFQFNHH